MFNLKRKVRTIRNAFKSKALVLMYHRISNPVTDLWDLAVSPQNFEQHLEILQESFNILPLSEIVKQGRNKKKFKDCVAISFDDGYVDNYLCAKPLLEKYDIPATFFVTSANIEMNAEFWWDELENIILHTPVLPQKIFLDLNPEQFSFDLGEEAFLSDAISTKHAQTKAFEPQTLRSELYFYLWKLLSPMTRSQQEQTMQQIREDFKVDKIQRPDYLRMSSNQIATLANNSLFQIGGHTESHPALAFHSKEFQYREIHNNKKKLQDLTSKPVELFAYPSGNFNDVTIELMKELNFNAAFTTKPCVLPKNSDLFKLGRFQVNNWQGDAFAKRVSNWLQ